MRFAMAAATAAAVFCGLAGSARAVPIQVALSPGQLTNQPGTDRWTWEFPQTPPLSLPANGTLQLDFAFDGGFLRLHDLGGAPGPAQLGHRDGLLDRLASQKLSRAKLELEIGKLDDEIDDQQIVRMILAGKAQQSQADLTETESALDTAHQQLETLEEQGKTIKAAIEKLGDDILTIGDKIQAFIDAFGDIASDVLDDLRDAYNDATETLQGLLGQQSQVAQQTSAASLVVTAKEVERNALALQTATLEDQIDTLDAAIALLETQKSEAETRQSQLTTLISVTNQELAQLPEDANAEGLLLWIDGPSGNPIPLFGQLLLDVAAGDATWTSPFFQGVFENASLQALAYADITPSFVDIAGFTLQLDLFGPPGENLSLYGLTFELLADEVSIVSRAGAVPVPEPATIALLGGGLLGLGWLRRRDRLRMA
jgi:hypothetical protein